MQIQSNGPVPVARVIVAGREYIQVGAYGQLRRRFQKVRGKANVKAAKKARHLSRQQAAHAAAVRQAAA